MTNLMTDDPVTYDEKDPEPDPSDCLDLTDEQLQSFVGGVTAKPGEATSTAEEGRMRGLLQWQS